MTDDKFKNDLSVPVSVIDAGFEPVTKEARKLRVLHFMSQHRDIALQPSNIYFNLEREHVTFSKKSMERYLWEMNDEGLVERLGESGGFYQITEEGIEYLEGHER